MSDLLERPIEILDDISGLPDRLTLIDMGSGQYACINATVPDPEGDLTCGFIAVFAEDASVEVFKSTYIGMSYGKNVTLSLEEALDIAKKKSPTVRGLALQRNGATVHPLRFVN